MCGIIGYVGHRPGVPIVVGGLRRLEYRGYDSSGVAVLAGGVIRVARAVGKLDQLDPHLGGLDERAADDLHVAMGHTRWATHGGVTERNAHPHVGRSGRIAVVHNGIVENFLALRRELAGDGVAFASETDTEVIVHLIERGVDAGMDLERATHATLARLQGSQAIVVMRADEPDRLVCARIGNAGGVCIGFGEGEAFVASDVPGILEHTRAIIFLESAEVAVVTADGVRARRLNGADVSHRVHHFSWDPVAAEKGEYRHFMLKEIHEQARAITDTIRGRVDLETGDVSLEDLPLAPGDTPERITLIGCGTSAYSALIGKFLIEGIARVPVEVDYGSEYRYRQPLVAPNSAVLGITQSGETADTLAAMDEARRRGSRVWSIVNAIGSQAQRVSDGHIAMRAGPEIGVCSTKAFTTSIVDQYLLACALSLAGPDVEGSHARARALARDLARLPNLVGRALDANPMFEELARRFHHREHFLYLGRGINYPVALEGALKLKEVSYIHAEGYPAGEMKHGPIALIDEDMPVVCICVRDGVYDKMISQIEQVKARNGIVIAIATEGDDAVAAKADHVMWVPEAPALLYPVLTAIPLQRLAYSLAVRRGCDVDQPRNLAKSVTVE
jgi:glucosamine--fructose-6-phosphate aminotransferase (isomerizing)